MRRRSPASDLSGLEGGGNAVRSVALVEGSFASSPRPPLRRARRLTNSPTAHQGVPPIGRAACSVIKFSLSRRLTPVIHLRSVQTVGRRPRAAVQHAHAHSRSPSYTSAWKSCIARSMDCTKMSNGGRSPSRTICRVLLAHNHLDRAAPSAGVHQVLDRGRHRCREEAALHRRAIACGEHLVALLEEPGARAACLPRPAPGTRATRATRASARPCAAATPAPAAACTPSRRTGATRRWTRRRRSRRRRHHRRRHRRARREHTWPPRASW